MRKKYIYVCFPRCIQISEKLKQEMARLEGGIHMS